MIENQRQQRATREQLNLLTTSLDAARSVPRSRTQTGFLDVHGLSPVLSTPQVRHGLDETLSF